MKHGKKYNESVKLLETGKFYDVDEAMSLAVKTATAKFDETVEIHVRLGVDSRQADQQVRGAIVLPNGIGKDVRVLVITKGDNVKAAEEAGADFVGAEEMVAKIQNENWLDFDAVIASPDMMGLVGRLGKVLGPRGLMPTPKAGTVTPDVAKAVTEQKQVRLSTVWIKPTSFTAPSVRFPSVKRNLKKTLTLLWAQSLRLNLLQLKVSMLSLAQLPLLWAPALNLM